MNEGEVEEYCKNQRMILPQAYSERKLYLAHRHNDNLDLNRVVESDEEEVNEEKQNVMEEIHCKMNAMSNLYMDLTTEELGSLQGIVEDSDDDQRWQLGRAKKSSFFRHNSDSSDSNLCGQILPCKICPNRSRCSDKK